MVDRIHLIIVLTGIIKKRLLLIMVYYIIAPSLTVLAVDPPGLSSTVASLSTPFNDTFGQRMELTINCLNGGTPVSESGTCKCRPSFTGRLCETEACLNDGVLIDQTGRYPVFFSSSLFATLLWPCLFLRFESFFQVFVSVRILWRTRSMPVHYGVGLFQGQVGR